MPTARMTTIAIFSTIAPRPAPSVSLAFPHASGVSASSTSLAAFTARRVLSDVKDSVRRFAVDHKQALRNSSSAFLIAEPLRRSTRLNQRSPRHC